MQLRRPGQQHQPAKPDHMTHKFDDPAKFAKSFDDPARDAWQMPSRVIESLALKPGMKVADIGAGTGYFSMRLAKVPAGITVFAVDVEPAMIDHLKKRAVTEKAGNVTTVLAGAASPNLPEPVDVVLCRRHLSPLAEPAGVLPRPAQVVEAWRTGRDH